VLGSGTGGGTGIPLAIATFPIIIKMTAESTLFIVMCPINLDVKTFDESYAINKPIIDLPEITIC